MSVIEFIYTKDYHLLQTSRKIAVLHFYAVWSEECHHMNSLLKEMSEKERFKDVIFGKIAAEQFPTISAKHKVTAVPTFVLFSNGIEVGRVDGADPGLLTTKLNEVIDAEELRRSTDLNSALTSSPVVLFMKGTPDQPGCSWSRQMVELLQENGVEFKSIDILRDSTLREGLRRSWPTFPQLWVEGRLLGGLEQVREWSKNNELQDRTTPLDDRLQRLINKSKVMVFMKGDRREPRCGFSRQLIEILEQTGVEYSTFDILQDEELRRALKLYSRWPTYPQLYVAGALIGGLDIVKEYHESGQLQGLLDG